MEIVIIFLHVVFLENFGAKKLGSNAFSTGPGTYWEVGGEIEEDF